MLGTILVVLGYHLSAIYCCPGQLVVAGVAPYLTAGQADGAVVGRAEHAEQALLGLPLTHEAQLELN